MSAIKLPVRAIEYISHYWEIRDADDRCVLSSIGGELAKQIALALNLHDDLVKCLRQSHDALRRASNNLAPHFGRPENSAFSVDAAIQQNESCLARAETDNETKP